jgi:rod shape determining protein RodA
MVSGLMPVVGVPLPFISYGGSFMLTSMAAVGILISIKMRRFIF